MDAPNSSSSVPEKVPGDSSGKKPPMKRSLKIAIFIMIGLMTIATILLIVFGDRRALNSCKACVPDEVDAVLVDRGRNRTDAQVARIRKYMPWIKSVLVLQLPAAQSPPPPTILVNGEEIPVRYVSTSLTDILELYRQASTLDAQLAADYIFLGDTVAPIRDIKPKLLFSRSGRVRAFTASPYEPPHEFDQFRELNAPLMITNAEQLLSFDTLESYFLSLTITQKIVTTIDQVHELILTGDQAGDDYQLNKDLPNHTLFTDVFISPLSLQQDQLNLLAVEYLRL